MRCDGLGECEQFVLFLQCCSFFLSHVKQNLTLSSLTCVILLTWWWNAIVIEIFVVMWSFHQVTVTGLLVTLVSISQCLVNRLISSWNLVTTGSDQLETSGNTWHQAAHMGLERSYRTAKVVFPLKTKWLTWASSIRMSLITGCPTGSPLTILT